MGAPSAPRSRSISSSAMCRRGDRFSGRRRPSGRMPRRPSSARRSPILLWPSASSTMAVGCTTCRRRTPGATGSPDCLVPRWPAGSSRSRLTMARCRCTGSWAVRRTTWPAAGCSTCSSAAGRSATARSSTPCRKPIVACCSRDGSRLPFSPSTFRPMPSTSTCIPPRWRCGFVSRRGSIASCSRPFARSSWRPTSPRGSSLRGRTWRPCPSSSHFRRLATAAATPSASGSWRRLRELSGPSNRRVAIGSLLRGPPATWWLPHRPGRWTTSPGPWQARNSLCRCMIATSWWRRRPASR